MKNFTVNTGYGYFKKDGKVVGLALLPIGEHKTKDDKEYIEVATQEELDNIVIYKPTASEAEKIQDKIQKEMSKLAIKSLKDKGELPEDYE